MILKNDIGSVIRWAREARCLTEDLANAMETMVANLHEEDQQLISDAFQECAVEGLPELKDNGQKDTAWDPSQNQAWSQSVQGWPPT